MDHRDRASRLDAGRVRGGARRRRARPRRERRVRVRRLAGRAARVTRQRRRSCARVGRGRVRVAVERATRRRGRSRSRRTTGRPSWITPTDPGSRDASGPPALFRRAFTLPDRGRCGDRASPSVRDVRGDQPVALQRRGRGRHRARTRLVVVRVPDPVRDPRRDRARRAGRQRARRRRRRRLVARESHLGDAPQRLRRPARPASRSSRSRTPTAHVETVTTDTEWRTATGPWLTADLYNGETYDARLRIDGWSRPGFDDAAWTPAELFAPEVGPVVARQGPPVRRTEELAVREVIITPSGRTILDFGQNLVGWVRFTVDGPAGDDRHAAPRRSARGRRARHAFAAQRRGDRSLHPCRRRPGDLGARVHVPRLPLRRGRRLADSGARPGRLHGGRDPFRLRPHGNVLVLRSRCSTGSTRTSSGACAATSSTSRPTARSATSASAGPVTSRCSRRRRRSCSTSTASSPTGWPTSAPSRPAATAWCRSSSRPRRCSRSCPRWRWPPGAMP